MTQRRTPSGQGPARRPGQAGRAGAGRTAAARGGTGRAAARDAHARSEPRRAPLAGRSADLTRSASRPAAARRAGSAGAAKRTTAPQPRRLTGRATVLLVILTALALAYTYPVRVYLDQKTDLVRMQEAQQEQRARIEGLREEVAKWQDDEYIRIQAKQRFYYVRPGETPLIPVWGDGETSGGASSTAGTSSDRAAPWYSTLWSSIEAADREPQQ